MADVIVYIKPSCPYCKKALAKLASLGQLPQLIDIAAEPDRRAEMIGKSGGKTTVPQIFINDEHIGGCDDLHALSQDELKNKLGE